MFGILVAGMHLYVKSAYIAEFNNKSYGVFAPFINEPFLVIYRHVKRVALMNVFLSFYAEEGKGSSMSKMFAINSERSRKFGSLPYCTGKSLISSVI